MYFFQLFLSLFGYHRLMPWQRPGEGGPSLIDMARRQHFVEPLIPRRKQIARIPPRVNTAWQRANARRYRRGAPGRQLHEYAPQYFA